MDDTTTQVVKSIAIGLVGRVAVVAATALVAYKILPSEQEASAENVIGAMILGLGILVWGWYRDRGRAILKNKVAELEGKKADTAPTPDAK